MKFAFVVKSGQLLRHVIFVKAIVIGPNKVMIMM